MDRDMIKKVEIYRAITGAIQERSYFGTITPCGNVAMAFEVLFDLIKESPNSNEATELAASVCNRSTNLLVLMRARIAEGKTKEDLDKANAKYENDGADEEDDDEEEDD